MRKVIAAINMTVDGFCDHTTGIPDEAIHEHYTELLNHAGVILYGRVTYQLMQFWQPILKKPTGEKAMDEFAVAIDRVPKLVFSHTLKDLAWDTARLATKDLEEEVANLKQQPGNDIYIGSPGLIASLTNLKMIDEYQLCVHPVAAGGGLPLFKNMNEKFVLKLIKTKTFAGGHVIHYYVPVK